MVDVVKKVAGLDYELGNFLLMPGCPGGQPGRAAELLLEEIRGFPISRYAGGTAIEFGRRYLRGNGGSVYIDSDHLEINTPEHLRAKDHVLHVHAGLRIARMAQIAVNERLAARGARLEVLANNCDGHVSYGSHLSMLTTAKCFDEVLFRKPHRGALLATHLVTSVLYTGQGMVGASNGRSQCDFQLSQRADWFERFAGIDTMQRRPLLNQRDEPHASSELARLHIIYFDLALAATACLLRVGTTQLVLALCEAGWIDATIALDDPVGDACAISRDLDLNQTYASAVRGRRMTAVDFQQALCDLAAELVLSGAVDEAVPDAREILRVWQETLDLLRRRELEALAARCDGWMKYLLLERHRTRRGLSWRSSEMKVLDLRYASLDPGEGLFLRMAEGGCVQGWPTADELERCRIEPPVDTRAYLRAHVLRRFGAEISHMDWSWIDFRLQTQRGWWSTARLAMSDPRRFTKAECGALLGQQPSLEELVSALAETEEEASAGLPAAHRSFSALTAHQAKGVA